MKRPTIHTIHTLYTHYTHTTHTLTTHYAHYIHTIKSHLHSMKRPGQTYGRNYSSLVLALGRKKQGSNRSEGGLDYLYSVYSVYRV